MSLRVRVVMYVVRECSALRITHYTYYQSQVQCWLCNDEGHSPCRCIEVKDWAELSNEDKMLENLKKQCKQCPKCGMGAYISDKNACNHMTCPCGHHWCWMCLKPWSTYITFIIHSLMLQHISPLKYYETLEHHEHHEHHEHQHRYTWK